MPAPLARALRASTFCGRTRRAWQRRRRATLEANGPRALVGVATANRAAIAWLEATSRATEIAEVTCGLAPR